jgi:hypothetical protein
MSNQKNIVSFIKAISGQANILTIPRLYISILDGDINAALLLSQIIYWSDKTVRADGYFYKTYNDWEDELGLSKYQLSRAAEFLKAKNLISTKTRKANGSPTIHYKADMQAIQKAIVRFLESKETSLSESKETSLSESKETSLSLTETTHKITKTQEDVTKMQNYDLELIPYLEQIGLSPESPSASDLRRASTLRAMTRGEKKANGQKRLDDLPTDVSELLNEFYTAWGHKMTSAQKSSWIKTAREWLEIGIAGADIVPMVELCKERGTSIRGPRSITWAYYEIETDSKAVEAEGSGFYV